MMKYLANLTQISRYQCPAYPVGDGIVDGEIVYCFCALKPASLVLESPGASMKLPHVYRQVPKCPVTIMAGLTDFARNKALSK